MNKDILIEKVKEIKLVAENQGKKESQRKNVVNHGYYV